MRRAAIAAGAIGSAALLFYAGTERNNTPALVLILMIGWVLTPYVLLFVADRMSKRWNAGSQTMLTFTTVLIAIVSLCFYGYGALGPVRARPAAPFVALPPLSWLAIAIAMGVALRKSRAPG